MRFYVATSFIYKSTEIYELAMLLLYGRHYPSRYRAIAELIPPGRVMTYGDVAEWLEQGGPRQVGRVMALYGGAVPWWRVVRADGALLPGHELRALDHYRAEGTPLKEASRAAEGHLPRLDMRRARWDGGERADGHT